MYVYVNIVIRMSLNFIINTCTESGMAVSSNNYKLDQLNNNKYIDIHFNNLTCLK